MVQCRANLLISPNEAGESGGTRTWAEAGFKARFAVTYAHHQGWRASNSQSTGKIGICGVLPRVTLAVKQLIVVQVHAVGKIAWLLSMRHHAMPCQTEGRGQARRLLVAASRYTQLVGRAADSCR